MNWIMFPPQQHQGAPISNSRASLINISISAEIIIQISWPGICDTIQNYFALAINRIKIIN